MNDSQLKRKVLGNLNQRQKSSQVEELVKKRPGDQTLYTKSIDSNDHPLQPYPIMELEKVIGFTVRNCPDIKWGRQSETQQQLIYVAGNIIIQSDLIEGNQKFYMGHSQPISCLDISRDGVWIVSGQQGNNAVVRVWDYMNIECLSAFATPYSEMVSIGFSSDRKLLITAGIDDHKREVLIVWGLENILQTRKPILVAKQSTSCNVLSIRISPVDNNRLISCGNENIRFWRIKNGHLPGASVVLNHHARNTAFAVFDFEYSYEDPQARRFSDKINRVFFGSKQGVLFQVNYHSQELEAVYKVHDQPISSLIVSAGFCVTGSKDQFLRVWPLDFSEFYIEAKHEGIITSLDVSLDGLQVACGTSTGGLGVLDISNHSYKTIVRSHTGKIIQAEVHPFSDLFITLSEDCTIRLWSLKKSEQVYEFTFPMEDKCCVLSSNPKGMYFTAGFRSGVIRVFDIENTQIIEEAKYHDCEIQHLTYNPVGTLLIASDVKSVYRVYDAQRNYQPIKTLEQFMVSQYNYSAFSQDSQVIATIGDSCTHINLFDGVSYQILLKIFCQKSIIKLLKWAANNVELVVGCEEGRVKVYGIERSPGAVHAYFLREQQFMHKGGINDLAISPNMRFLYSVGNESFVKVWDYEFTLKGPGSNQTFIGHSGSISNICVADQGSTIISLGGEEGIFVWSFKGYTGANERLLQLNNYTLVQSQTFGKKNKITLDDQQQTDQKEILHKDEEYFQDQQEVLDQVEELDIQQEEEQLDQPPKPESPNKLVPIQSLARRDNLQSSPLSPNQFDKKIGQKSNFKPYRISQDFQPFQIDYVRSKLKKSTSSRRIPILQIEKKEGELPFKQYEAPAREIQSIELPPQIKLQTLMGYNQQCHNNLVWCQAAGWIAYSILNYVVIEYLQKDRKQQCIEFSYDISVLTLDPLQLHLLVGSAHKTSNEDEAPISVVDVKTLQIQRKLIFHTRGVQQMVFTENSKFLITVGNYRECTVAVWDWQTKQLLASSYTLDKINDIHISQWSFSKERLFEFCTVGRDQVYFWAFNKGNTLEYYDIFIERNKQTGKLEEITSLSSVWFKRNAVKLGLQQQGDDGSGSAIAGSQQLDMSFQSLTRTQKSQETELREESRHSIQQKTQEDKKEQVQERQQDENELSNIVQCYILGLKSGEIILVRYGDFKVLFRRQVCPSEINIIQANQAAGKLIICSCDCFLYWLDISRINTLDGFVETGLQVNRIRLTGIPIALSFEPLMQQAIISFNNGNVSFISLQEGFVAPIASTINNQQSKVNLTKCIEDSIVITTQQNHIRFWSLQNGELLTEFNFNGQPTTILYDGQFKNVVFFLEGEVKVVQLDRLDVFESYSLDKNQKNLKGFQFISSCYGVADGIQVKLVLGNDNWIYSYDQLYKAQEYTIRLKKVVECQNTLSLVAYIQKKVIFAVEKDNGVVNTLIIDYNPDREYSLGFTLYDIGNFKQSPHGELDNQQELQQTQTLYNEISMSAQVSPARGFDGLYFAILNGLQYLYGRNYIKKQNVIQIGLDYFPLCISPVEEGPNLRILIGMEEGTIQIIDPTQTEDKQTIKAHLGSKIVQLHNTKKKTHLFFITENGCGIYNL